MNSQIKDFEYFNKPWMDGINPKLLHRFWVKKGSPGILRMDSPYGLKWDCRTTFRGEVRWLTEVLN